MILYGKDKIEMLKDTKSLIKAINRQIKDLKNGHKKNIYFTRTFPTIINNFLFYYISAKDILLCIRIFYLCESPDEQNLMLRTLSLNLYEFLENLKYYSGKDFVKEVKMLPRKEALLSELQLLKDEAKNIRMAFNNRLADIRHNTIAHKDVDAIKLFRTIDSVNYN